MILALIILFSFAASCLLLYRTVMALNRFKYQPVEHVETNLPSVSVCIAARNETHALAQCLERVLKSDYEKLEILVLDDSSDDNTPLIIKSFASAGVRFIAGRTLPEGWLGKNFAYQVLVDEASGEYILFLDVDTVIHETTISQLVDQMRTRDKSMLSVLPQRHDSYRASAILGTLRYCWELLLASRDSPPAASALWIIKKIAVSDNGISLISYETSVRPERHIARELQHSGKYSYLVATKQLGVSFEKRLSSQHETATRLYCAMGGKRIGAWLLMTVFLLLLIAPIAVVALSSSILLNVAALGSLLITTIAFGFYFVRTNGTAARLPRLVLWPLLVLCEVYLLTKSYIAYSTRSVTWKGRPVAAELLKHDDFRIDE